MAVDPDIEVDLIEAPTFVEANFSQPVADDFFLKLSRVKPQYVAASSRLNTRLETGASSLAWRGIALHIALD